MEFTFRIDYKEMDDRTVVTQVLAIPHNEEAAAFLLYDRYDPLLRSVYNHLAANRHWYDDCVDELFIHLRGTDGSWHPLASFEWRSTFGCWLKRVARYKFIDVLQKLIDNERYTISLDVDGSNNPSVQIPDGGEEDYERRQRKVMLMEAIGQLKDDDQRFVILKRLEGYNSQEIALLLQKKWQRQGIVKYGYKKNSKEKHIVVPDAAYVDIRTQRAKENLRVILAEMI